MSNLDKIDKSISGSPSSSMTERTWTKSTRSISGSPSRRMPSNGHRLQRLRHRNRRPQPAPNNHPIYEHTYFS